MAALLKVALYDNRLTVQVDYPDFARQWPARVALGKRGVGNIPNLPPSVRRRVGHNAASAIIKSVLRRALFAARVVFICANQLYYSVANSPAASTSLANHCRATRMPC